MNTEKKRVKGFIIGHKPVEYGIPETELNAAAVENTDGVRHRRKNVRGLKYQAQVLGFLSERLWTMYLQANFSPDRIALFPYMLMEEGMKI